MSDHYSLMQGRKFAMTFARKVFEEAALPSSRCDVDSLHSTQDLAGSAGTRISMFIEPAQDLVSQGQFSDSATLDNHSEALTWVVTHRGIMENENSALVTTCALKLKSLIDGNATVPSELVDGVELQVQRGAVAPSTSYYGVEKQYYHIFARNSSTIAASGSDAGSMNPRKRIRRSMRRRFRPRPQPRATRVRSSPRLLERHLDTRPKRGDV